MRLGVKSLNQQLYGIIFFQPANWMVLFAGAESPQPGLGRRLLGLGWGLLALLGGDLLGAGSRRAVVRVHGGGGDDLTIVRHLDGGDDFAVVPVLGGLNLHGIDLRGGLLGSSGLLAELVRFHLEMLPIMLTSLL